MSGNANTIALKVFGSEHFEAPAAAADIKPGCAISLLADGTVDLYTGAADSANPDRVLIALEDALQGKTIDDAYATGSTVFYRQAQPGETYQILLGASQTVTKILKLEHAVAGDGLFIIADEDEGQFEAIEAVTSTTGAVSHIAAVMI